MSVELFPLEIAARAVCRVATVAYPDTASGRAKADAYVEMNWLSVWRQMRGEKP